MKQLAVVIPVLNERDNVSLIVNALDRTLTGLDWEALFVDDDSSDGTADAVSAVARCDERIRLITRIGRRGLASACVEGMLATTASAVAVIDGDLQHDETLLPVMWTKLQEERLDLVIASRNMEGGGMGDFAAERVRLSHAGKMLASWIIPARLAPNGVSDPMSGYFMVERKYLLEVVRDLSQIGFKILLDLIASSRRPVRIAEVPYRFRTRQHGASKLDTGVETDFLLLIVDKLIGQWIPARYAFYAGVGLVGMFVHLVVLTALLRLTTEVSFAELQAIATGFAIVSNFFINNAVTYSDRKLEGAGKLLLGLLIYGAGCSLGAAANVGLAQILTEHAIPTLVAGAAGMLVSSVWNFVIANVFTWRLSLRRAAVRRK